jgi:hypothetical protein
MEMQKICQKYLNRYINAYELQDALATLGTESLNDSSKVSLSALKTSIAEIILETNDDEDELVKKEREQQQSTIDYLDRVIKKNKDIPQDLKDELERMRSNSKKHRDNYERWSEISNAITENKFYKHTLEYLSDSQLLSLIAEDISAPRPIPIDAKTFDRLVEVGAEEKARESLWRLALNYHYSGFNIQQIADIFIEKEDTYYLTELISAVGDVLNNDAIIDRLTDPQMIKDFIAAKPILTPYITEEQFKKLESK